MGDSGALLLGFVARRPSAVQGLLKTAAPSRSCLPLLVLAVPILDTTFVVAQRLKHGEPVCVGDRRTSTTASCDIGFSQRRAVVYLYAWCLTLAAAALATRFVPSAQPRRLAPLADVASPPRSGCVAVGASRSTSSTCSRS